MLFVGLTGGYATGKSHVGRMLAKLGCHVIEADQLGRQVQASGGEAYPAIVERFGEGVLRPDGEIDRKKLGAIVFADPAALAALNEIVHPAVRRLEKQLADRIVAGQPDAIIVVEAAIHIETGGYKRFDKMILTVCDREEQIRRAMKRDHLTEAEVLARLSRQMPLEEKRKYADYIIDTSGAESRTWTQVKQVYNSIKSLI